MTLEEAFGPSINVYRNVLITRVSSGHEISSKDSISCTYDYVELDNGITLKNLKVPRSRYELIDENHRLQTRADLYVDDSELTAWNNAAIKCDLPNPRSPITTTGRPLFGPTASIPFKRSWVG